jgi:beta-mannosidase
MFSGVGEASWAFKTEFEVSEEELKKPFADLVFDGLDTFATAFLVSLPILRYPNY